MCTTIDPVMVVVGIVATIGAVTSIIAFGVSAYQLLSHKPYRPKQ